VEVLKPQGFKEQSDVSFPAARKEKNFFEIL
jgi:hypothetical protein